MNNTIQKVSGEPQTTPRYHGSHEVKLQLLKNVYNGKVVQIAHELLSIACSFN